MNNSKNSKIGLICSIAAIFALSSFGVVAAKRTSPTASYSITITNSSTWEIRHIYLAHPEQDDWSADQLNSSSIAPGTSATVSNISWDQPNIKVIAEDQNGCFFYQTVAREENSSWTIPNNATPDCGT
jgi:hypothetical protein